MHRSEKKCPKSHVTDTAQATSEEEKSVHHETLQDKTVHGAPTRALKSSTNISAGSRRLPGCTLKVQSALSS